MRTRQRHTATALCNTHGGYEDKSILFCSGCVERVLTSIRDPLFDGRWLAEEDARLAPPQSDEPVCRFFDNRNVFDSADDVRGVLDVGDCGPDRRLRT